MKRRLQRKVKKAVKDKRIVVGGIVSFIVITFLVFTIFGNAEEPQVQREAKYELTEVDIFSIRKWDSRDVSVMGIMLRDDIPTVLKVLGTPDKQSGFEDGIVNMEYGARLGFEDTGLLLHFEGNQLRRITLREPFNEFLQGKTRIEHTKTSMYSLFGKPTEIKFIPLKEGSALVFRNYVYASKGLEVFIRKQEQIGFALFL